MSQPPGQFPEDFQRYELTFFAAMGRAQLWGADDATQQSLRNDLYNGWVNRDLGYWERRQARQDYKYTMSQVRRDYAERRGFRGDEWNPTDQNDPDFDWEAWKQEYAEAQQAERQDYFSQFRNSRGATPPPIGGPRP